jgi:hypothetical protein
VGRELADIQVMKQLKLRKSVCCLSLSQAIGISRRLKNRVKNSSSRERKSELNGSGIPGEDEPSESHGPNNGPKEEKERSSKNLHR